MAVMNMACTVLAAVFVTTAHSRPIGHPSYGYSSPQGYQPQLGLSLTEPNTRSPVVLVPGLIGTKLDVKNTNFFANYLPNLCYTFGRFRNLWGDDASQIWQYLCFNDLKLEYDANTNSYANASGVEVVTPYNFGDINALLGSRNLKLVNILRDENGYTDNDLRAAFYDWRLGPSALESVGYFDNLKAMIEDMYDSNNNARVSIVTISMGGAVSLHFLRNIVTQTWKDKYIANFIPLGAPWAGSFYQLQTIIKYEGYGFDISEVGRTWQSTTWLLPRGWFTKERVLVETPSRKYTASDYEQFFNDLEYPQGYDMLLGSDLINVDFPGPNVTTWCVYGSNVSTPIKYIYPEDFPKREDPKVINGTGDDTISQEAGELCLNWKNGHYPVHAFNVPNVDHVYLVTGLDAVLQGVARIVNPSPIQKRM